MRASQLTTDHVVRFRFHNISIEQAEKGLLRLLGSKILELSPHRLSCSIGRSRQVTMSFEEISQSCLLEGSRDLVLQFATLLQQFEDARDKEVEDAIRFVSLTNIDPDVLNRALMIWKQTARRGQTPAGPQLRIRVHSNGAINHHSTCRVSADSR